jgi:hypothetical protein
MVDYPIISQLMKKFIPHIHSMFRNFATTLHMLLQFIPYSGFSTTCPLLP